MQWVRIARVTDRLEIIETALALPGEGSSDFDLHQDLRRVKPSGLRPAAVLVPLIFRDGQLQVILTKRSSALKHHPGQIAFPGGKADKGDISADATALREAHEEIGLPSNIVQILGQLPPHETVTGFSVVPVVGLIGEDFDIIAETGEVDEVFLVPLDHVTNLAKFSQQGRYWQGQMRMYETVPYGPYYIWGATARMLRAFAERMPQ
ncbi:CoA pyrophosphatase [Aliiroseovarius sp. 2305UL8-7]|uniref:CoA pyrophosphatase n=1 Tax=Aliiroseovarius conchicola TaxID=3121637 RepID=UPI0035273409